MSNGKKATLVSRKSSADNWTAFSLLKHSLYALIKISVSVSIKIVAICVSEGFRKRIPEHVHRLLALFRIHLIGSAGDDADVLILYTCSVQRQQEKLIQMQRINT